MCNDGSIYMYSSNTHTHAAPATSRCAIYVLPSGAGMNEAIRLTILGKVVQKGPETEETIEQGRVWWGWGKISELTPKDIHVQKSGGGSGGLQSASTSLRCKVHEIIDALVS